MKNRIPKHKEDAVNALLDQRGLNLKTLTKEELEQLPEAIRTAVINLLQPYGWQVQPDQVASEVRYLTVAAAVKYTSMSRWTLGRAHARHELKMIKLGKARSSKTLFDRDDLDRWLKGKK